MNYAFDISTLRFASGVVLVAMLALGSSASRAQPPANSAEQGYQLEHIDADELAERLRPLLNSGDDPARIAVDQENNRIIVHGSPTWQRKAGELLQLLDQPAAGGEKHQPSRGDQETVRGYRVPTEKLGHVAAELQSRYPPQSGVKVLPDGRTGQLIVVAPLWVHQSIERHLRIDASNDGDRPAEVPAIPGERRADASARVLHLRRISCRDLEVELNRLFEERLQVTNSADGQTAQLHVSDQGQELMLDLDRSKNIVRFSGTPRQVRIWSDILRSLDSVSARPDHRARIVRLQDASRKHVHRVIGLLATGSSESARVTAATKKPVRPTRLPAQSGRPAAVLAANTPGATPQNSAASEATGPPDSATTGVPNNTDSDAPGSAEREGGLIEPVQIETIEGSDVVIIKGRQQDVQRVIELIKQIESLSAVTEPEIRILHLNHVDSSSLAELVNQLYGDIYAQRQGPVSITALVKPNAVLLIGREESVKVVVELVGRLDQPVDPESQFHVFQLRHISATTAEQTIREFFDDATAPREDGGRGGLGTRVRVTSEVRSNALIIQSSPRDLIEVQRLIKVIDVETSRVVNRVEIFQLRNSRAEDLAPILQQAISGQPGDAAQRRTAGPLPGQLGGGPPVPAVASGTRAELRSSMLTFTVMGPEGRQMLQSGIMSDVRIHADASTNSLIVTGPEQAMGLIAALIERLDQLPSAEAQIKVFTLENGDAGAMRDMLDELFAQRNQAGELPVQTAAGVAESSLIPLRFTVDRRTNSIIITGAAPDLIVVDAIIRRLDGVDLRQRKNLVYRLRYTPAPFVATAIQDFLRAEQLRTQQELLALTRGTETALNPFEQIEREVVVVAEQFSNSLVISATPRFYDEVLQIIREIDSLPPMAMIQVLIAQITFDEDAEFGVEFGLQDSLLFDRGVVLGNPGAIDQGNVTSGENVAGQGLTDLLLGRTNTTLGFGGMVLAAGSESVNILMRALEQVGTVEILARPQIMTLDNEPARVQVGADVRIPSGTSTTQTGLVNIITEERSTGTILTVHPRISPDGTVALRVFAERSRLGPESEGTAIAIDNSGSVVRSPQIELVRAETALSVRSGQTGVFSGLITHDTVSLSRRVPLLADVPVLGHLFRFDQIMDRRSELLIIMTPHVIRTPEDLERLSYVESTRMHWCLADIIRMHGEPGLVGDHGLWHPSEIMTVYPDGDPAEYESILRGPTEATIPWGPPSGMGPGQPGGVYVPAPSALQERPPGNVDQAVPVRAATFEAATAGARLRRAWSAPVEPKRLPAVTRPQQRVAP